MKPIESILRINKLANAYQISCAVHAAAAHGFDKILNETPQSIADIAAQCSLAPSVLLRLLRFLSTLRVVNALDNDCFTSTDLTEHLNKVDNLAVGAEAVRAWAAMSEAIPEANTAFEHANGSTFYDLLNSKPKQAERWALYNQSKAEAWAQAFVDQLTEVIPIEGTETLADMGAGGAHLVAAWLQAYPHGKAILCDLPQAIKNAQADLARHAIRDQVQLVASDLIKEAVPLADIYVLAHLLLNLNDQDAVTVLSHCSQQMTHSSKLFIIESIMPEAGAPQRVHHYGIDLHLALMWDGQERTQSEFKQLLEQAQIELSSVENISCPDGFRLQTLVCTKP